jgi:hypothetical protein
MVVRRGFSRGGATNRESMRTVDSKRRRWVYLVGDRFMKKLLTGKHRMAGMKGVLMRHLSATRQRACGKLGQG